MGKLHKVISLGNIHDGFELEDVQQNLVNSFKLDPDQAEKVIGTKGLIIKKKIDESKLEKLLELLEKAGLKVMVKPIQSDEPDLLDDFIEKEPNIEDEHGKFLQTDSEETVTQSEVIPFEFKAEGTEYFRIWIVNLLLSIATLGIYSAWAKVRRRKYLYANTILNDSAFEYLANPIAILKGRIIVAILGIIYFVTNQFFPLYGLAFSLVFAIILPWLVIRSMAFNARNTSYRNIRFGFEATYWEAAKAFILWPLLGVVTAGLMIPYAVYKQKLFLISKSRYGTTSFEFTATAGAYYKIFIKSFLLLVLSSPLFGILFVALQGEQLEIDYISIMIATYGVFIVIYLFIFTYYSVRSTNLLLSSLELADNCFNADLKFRKFLWIVVSNTGLLAITAGIFYPWAKIRTLKYKFEHIEMTPAENMDSFVAAEEKNVSALGEEMNDLFDFDFGL